MLNTLIEKMKNGVADFKFLKKDGTIRIARGTLNPDLLPEREDVSETSRKKNDSIQSFYDLDKKEWRCFIKDYLISVD